MSEAKHTPTPWVACENDPDGMDYDKLWITTDDRLYNSYVPIAEIGIDFSEPMNTEQLANADFIVRAVNNHDDMLAALESIANTYDDSWAVGSQERRIGDLARSAIAKAEGRQP